MALANFIDRAATSASQVLANFELQPFLERLDNHVVGIGFDAEAASSPEGRSTLDLAVRLLARLYPRMAIVPISDMPSDYLIDLEATALAINPNMKLVRSSENVTIALVVGWTTTPFSCHTFYIGSNGWRVLLSNTAPVGSGVSGNPVGAGAGACLGAANVFRTIFAPQLENGDPDKEVNLSMLTFTTDTDLADAAAEREVDIGSTHLVGVGAIGNGFLWAMGRWANIKGELHMIDHEEVDLTNLQRYVLSEQKTVGKRKTEMAATHLASTSLNATPHSTNWQGYVAECDNWCFDRVAVALDSAKDRIAVQGSLPKWIVNAWTQESDLGVSRHTFGRGACLACLYMPAGKTKDQHEIVAEELGIPEATLEVRTLLQQGTPVDASFVNRVASALGVEFKHLSKFVGQPLASFHQSAICGGLMLKLTDGKVKVKTVVPMAFQSALAGIMLAAEVVKHAMGAAPAPTTSTRINLMRPLASHLHDPKSRDTTGRCICADEDFLAIYTAKYAYARSKGTCALR